MNFNFEKFQLPIKSFKEKIASQIGVPVEQQRLIFRGKVLKDEQLLAEYRILASQNSDNYIFVFLEPNLTCLVSLSLPFFERILSLSFFGKMFLFCLIRKFYCFLSLMFFFNCNGNDVGVISRNRNSTNNMLQQVLLLQLSSTVHLRSWSSMLCL